MRWRKSAWALIAWTALSILNLVYSVVATYGFSCSDPSNNAACGTYVVSAIVVDLFVWFVVAVPLAIIWQSARRKR